ncbi:HAD-superfamily hydrolase, subfamily IA, variant 1 [Halorhabdus utahensis DSM 12940]|uniref:HAD-superfamily hydrolase, subfamily IA, variant 1 n=1 Tax=Halorhabdus utahensis (strain DSM 12940 / JCM 11049 / AX-2) TaxID=519442 RepID=C7NMB5_HALUD|nr:HAD family hydrolase [Halorhabdus utahensis]ACV11323.1 HAD-superfamily hydrolase, subfamily IA, variant 1 [Halorhabdus utahensis DSM 12940]
MTVDAVLFDLDDTLCEYRRPAGDVLSAAFERVGVEPWFPIETFYDRFEEFARPGDDIRDLRRRSFAAFAEEAGLDEGVGRAVAEAFEAERDQSNVRFLPGAREAVQTAAERYRVGLVTNGDPWMQSQKLAGLGIGDRFETIVHGGHDAAYKPDPEPFYTALDELGVDAGRAVHVGNSLSADVTGAHNAGLRSVWLDGDASIDPDPVPDHRVESMHDVAEEPWH